MPSVSATDESDPSSVADALSHPLLAIRLQVQETCGERERIGRHKYNLPFYSHYQTINFTNAGSLAWGLLRGTVFVPLCEVLREKRRSVLAKRTNTAGRDRLGIVRRAITRSASCQADIRLIGYWFRGQ